MRHVTSFPRPVREIMTAWIPMPDGTRLAARIWLPADAEANPVPAVLEYLPYRRRDGTAYRDSITQPYLAGHGYAAVRVDIRGTGDSGGLMLDEYDLPEIHDGAAVIEWLAQQPWCTGQVGMWGISWGGFNALQVAALAPPALKAIITMGFTHDRYDGDCHFMGGCLLEGNISWGGTYLANASRPPDPAVVGPGWRAQWLNRLDAIKPPLDIWLRHQRRDDYWKPGSVCEDFSRIKAAVYAVTGWQDSYSRNVPALLDGLDCPKKALIGPWAHGWPHMARPGPAIGFMQEAIRWWDHWLKGIDTGIMDEPMIRAWMSEWVKPAKLVATWPGRWIAADGFSPATTTSLGTAVIKSPQTLGHTAGYQNSYGLGPDLADDQRADDEVSVCFDGAALTEHVEIFGEPAVELEISCDKPQALLAARLCDVAPDGSSLRVSYGLLNLTHRDGPANPAPLEPGRRYRVRIPLCAMAYAFPAGHRIRVALSTAYFPIAWPSPEAATVTVHGGVLHLPRRAPRPSDARLAPFGEPEGAAPRALVETRPRATDRPQDRIMFKDDGVEIIRTRDRGAWRTTDSDVDYDSNGELRFAVAADDPLCASQSIALTTTIGRPGWRARTETALRLWATATDFRVTASLKAYDGEAEIFARDWDLTIPRDNV